MFILVHSKSKATSSILRNPLRKSTKQSHLDHFTTTKKVTLNTSRHTLFLANRPTLRLLTLILSRTHSQSQQTQKWNLFSRVQGLHLLLKIIWNQYKQNPIPHTFINHKTLSNLSSLKNSKTLFKNLLLKSVFLNIFKDVVCYHILTNSFIAFNDWSKHLKTGA